MVMAISKKNLKITAMKTRKILLGFLFALGFFSSCDKYDRPAELSIDTQILEFDNTILTRMFTIVNMGDELLEVDAIVDKEWLSVVGSDVTLSHAQSSVISVHIDTDFFQEFGIYSATLLVRSNGGHYTVPIKVYYFQSGEPMLALDLDYLKFSSTTSQDYFTLYNDGLEGLNFSLQTEADWVSLSQEVGTIIPDAEQRIYVDVDRTGLASGMYAAEINVTSNGGDALVDLDMDVAVYSITFFNPVFTPIEILTSEFDPVTIEPGERFSFLFVDNPLTFSYTASTRGVTDDGSPLGVDILWDEEIDVSSYDSPTFNGSTTITDPGASSRLCLSCHDGTVALENFGGISSGTNFIDASARIGGVAGNDMSTEHPISFDYTDALATSDGGLFPPTTTNSGLGSTIDNDMLFSSRMECASCHDVHNRFGVMHLLKMSNVNSELCLSCHNK